MTSAVASTVDEGTGDRSFFKRVIVPALIVLVGLAIVLYPVVATTWNNFQQQQIAEEYAREFRSLDPRVVSQQVEDARRYNESVSGGPILDPWLARISEDNVEYQHYLAQLNANDVMSQVAIPSIDVKLPVYHGTAEETLQRGLGHLYGTSLPVGGEGTHSVITGHTGLTNATLFDNLDEVEVGDVIYLSTLGQRLKYEVHDLEVVLPNEVDSLGVQPGQDLLTLITCTPYGVNTHRLLVHAHRVPMDPAEEKIIDEIGFTWQWWMWALTAFAVAVVAFLGFWVWREMRVTKKGKYVA